MVFLVGNWILLTSCVRFCKFYTSKQTKKNHLEGNTLIKRRHLRIPEWPRFSWIIDEGQTVKMKLQPLQNSFTLVLVLSVQKENLNVSDNFWIWKSMILRKFWGTVNSAFQFQSVVVAIIRTDWDALWISSLAFLLGYATVTAMFCLSLSSVEVSPIIWGMVITTPHPKLCFLKCFHFVQRKVTVRAHRRLHSESLW